MPEAYTKDEAESLIHAKQDIDLFLLLASSRIELLPERVPFPPARGRQVIAWLRALATRYGNGEDITKV